MDPTNRGGYRLGWKRDRVVLCVDDDPGVLNALRRLFRNEPCEVITARSAEEALGWLQEVLVDLVISDQRMPGMTGMELLEEVRKRFPKTARVLLTAYRTPSLVGQGLVAGVDIYFKPWNEEVLGDTVRRLLGWNTGDAQGPGRSFDRGGEG
jgi:YesN/AraC family two-component response regulator